VKGCGLGTDKQLPIAIEVWLDEVECVKTQSFMKCVKLLLVRNFVDKY
jgi:hypothetical protein